MPRMSLNGSSDPTNGRLVTDYVRCKSVDQKWFAVLGLSRGKELRAKPGRKGETSCAYVLQYEVIDQVVSTVPTLGAKEPWFR